MKRNRFPKNSGLLRILLTVYRREVVESRVTVKEVSENELGSWAAVISEYNCIAGSEYISDIYIRAENIPEEYPQANVQTGFEGRNFPSLLRESPVEGYPPSPRSPFDTPS